MSSVATVSDNNMYIRCFDLGGSGLKTAVLCYDKITNKMTMKSDIIQLGKCPDQMKISEWVRYKLKEFAATDLDKEVLSKYSFAFSLAGLNKLRTRAVETSNMSALFNLPSDKTRSIDDGAAHLLGSLKALQGTLPKTGVIWNFSIGTAVGFGFTNSKQKIKPLEDLHNFFGQEPWNVPEPTTSQEIWRAGGSLRGFDRIVADRGGRADTEAIDIFANRWKTFIHDKIIDHSINSGKKWGTPDAVVFTRGHLDYHGDRLVKRLNSTGLKVKAYMGPHNAALFGAAWNVIASSRSTQMRSVSLIKHLWQSFINICKG